MNLSLQIGRAPLVVGLGRGAKLLGVVPQPE